MVVLEEEEQREEVEEVEQVEVEVPGLEGRGRIPLPGGSLHPQMHSFSLTKTGAGM